MAGTFYGIGVGAGDPELLTIKAQKVLSRIDILVAPVTGDGKNSLALSIVQELVPPRAQILLRQFPMVTDPNTLNTRFELIAEEIEKMVNQGKQVGFVTLGDPMLYSTYIYLLRILLAKGVPVQTIPGITSFSAASSRIGMSLADKDEKIAIIPYVYTDDTIDEILRLFDTVVIMKARGNCGPLIDKLAGAGMKDNAVFVSRLGLDGEILEHNLDNIKGLDASYLSLIIARKRR